MVWIDFVGGKVGGSEWGVVEIQRQQEQLTQEGSVKNLFVVAKEQIHLVLIPQDGVPPTPEWVTSMEMKEYDGGCVRWQNLMCEN